MAQVTGHLLGMNSRPSTTEINKQINRKIAEHDGICL
jgi:hypothetical protein